MNIKEILQLEIKQINKAPLTNIVENVYIGDLLSFVMANGKEGALWLTVQKHLNVVAVAELNDFAGIIFVQNSFRHSHDKKQFLHNAVFLLKFVILFHSFHSEQ